MKKIFTILFVFLATPAAAQNAAQFPFPFSAGGGGGGSPGGSNTDVQFNNSSAFGGDSGFTYAGNGQATLALGTITANAKALNITATFNNSATTFDAPLFANITNTASHSGSMIADFQVGGATSFGVGVDGTIYIGETNITTPGPGNSGGTYTWNFSNQNLTINNSGAGTFIIGFGSETQFYSGSVILGSNKFSLGGSTTFNADISGTVGGRLWMDTTAFNINAKLGTFRVYNTQDNYQSAPTNYERGVFDWTTNANVLTIGTQAGGTGTLRTVAITGAAITMTAVANSATTSALCYNTSTGAITYDGTVGTCNTSSRRLKYDIKPLDRDAIAAVMNWHPDTYYYNADQHTSGQQVGLIAEDLAATDPRLVATDDEGRPASLRVFAIIGYLTAAIQKQNIEIEELKRKIR